ncbi:tetratricopeptide (TPR) repeat protein [Sphingomicrobium lutaoense]|uniref:Tetratricopeptide (TPR) repeat protein n=1 Tax=Sphingomicrobium lutaoense TaxID=515949 RepID=A0A839YZJ6_9SPHN|nr:tetratricopeptide repeat protein [Sphingomicrobium lutaoense]MBB3763748.1 tetratricopeptide (TPR) repeat protein [Sphingomicrobium lutaoense]
MAGAALAASPAQAADIEAQRLSLFVHARAAELLGDHDRAATYYSRVTAQGVKDDALAADAMSSAIIAGRFDLARQIGAAAPAERFNLDGRLFLLADALRDGRTERALSLLSSDKAGASLDFAAPFVRAWIGLSEGSPERRQAAIRLVTGMDKAGPMASYMDEQAAFLLLANGQPDEALDYIETALADAGGREARMRLTFADGLFAAGSREDALALVAGNDPILLAARRQLESGRGIGARIDTPAEGLSDLLAALAVDVNRGNRRDLPLALAQVARVADPANSQATIIASLLLDALDRPDDALALLAGVGRKDPLAAQARDAEVQALLAADRLDEALVAARKSGSGPGAQARIGDVYAAMERHEEAAQAYARERAGNLSDWTLLFLEATQRDMAGDWDGAKVLLRHALAAEPRQPIVLNYLGYTMLEMGEDPKEAAALIRAAHEVRPSDPSITDSLGWAQYKLGLIDEAVQTLGKAVALEPGNEEIYEHYGDALSRAGHVIEARFAWQAARSVAEDEKRIGRLDSKLVTGLSAHNAAP